MHFGPVGASVAEAKQSTGSKGPALEEALKAYFQRAGYFAVRGVPFVVNGDEVTDVDIWLYERPAALTRRRMLVDAKNRKTPRAGERVVWAAGLKVALGADDAIVATTDKRESVRSLSSKVGVTLLDGNAVARIIGSKAASSQGSYQSDIIDIIAAKMDEGRHSDEWRDHVYQTKAALLTALGAHSANRGLMAGGFFAEQLAVSPPNSKPAESAWRVMLFCFSLASIGIDYMLSSLIFEDKDNRRKKITDAIRFGTSGQFDAVAAVSTAISLARKHADNGGAVAKQIEYSFYNEADQIPADVIADIAERYIQTDTFFSVARELEAASLKVNSLGFDHLSSESKSMLGAFLDFNGISREKVARNWSPSVGSSGATLSREPTDASLGPGLFSSVAKPPK